MARPDQSLVPRPTMTPVQETAWAIEQQPEVWSSAQIAVIHWLTLPEEARRPKTQRELAEQLGYHENTISEWKRLPGFPAAVMAAKRALISVEDVGRVLDALVRKATRHGAEDVAAARAVLEYVGLLGAHVEPEPGAPTTVKVTIDGEELEVQLSER